MVKFFEGGYVPVLVAVVFFVVMVVWKTGRRYLAEDLLAHSPPFTDFVQSCRARGPVSRVPRIGIFMASQAEGVPPVLQRHAERIGAVPETVLLLTIQVEHVPVVEDAEKMQTATLGEGFYRIVGRYGFMEAPDAPALLAAALRKIGLSPDPTKITWYLGRETFLATEKGRMGAVSESIFALLSRNSRTATSYFAIPPEYVVEFGTQIDL
jgi:KUP system potassium uptake protein